MMKHICLAMVFTLIPVFVLLALSPAPLVAGSPSPLISPWDASPVPLTQDPYECGPTQSIAPDLTITKGLGKSNLSPAVRQAVYAESDEALHDLTSHAVHAADTFRRTGSQAAARCVIAMLAHAAADHAMAGYMATDDAAQEQNMALRSVTIAYLKVRNSGIATTEEQALISAWLEDIAHQERKRIESGPCGQKICGAHGHSGMGVVMAGAAVAIAANDRRLFSWSVGQYHAAIHLIDERGMFHYDTHGQYALSFSLVSAGCLVQIAEFGETNGLPMYAYDHGRVHLFVETVSRGLIDAGPFSRATGTQQRISATIEPQQIVWAAAYNRRFPDPVIGGLLQQVGSASVDLWGGEQASSLRSDATK
jgi:poly(beta-D-mannuronate) lyase